MVRVIKAKTKRMNTQLNNYNIELYKIQYKSYVYTTFSVFWTEITNLFSLEQDEKLNKGLIKCIFLKGNVVFHYE